MLLKKPVKLMFSKEGHMTYCCKPVLHLLLKNLLFPQRTNYVIRNSDHLRHNLDSVTLTKKFICKLNTNIPII